MSAAQRRRQRRLRSMLRHEQQSIRMALATVMHHSYKVHTENGAPRSQTTATRAREGEVHEQHDGLRAQNRPLPGTRPEPLAEVSEPQGPAATVGYVAARPPLIWWGPKLLADSSAEAIDGRTLRYLLKENLARKKEEERRRTQQETQLQQRGPLAGAASSSRSVRRKKKKRKRRKLPRAPLPRCRRPCDLQRQVPAALQVLRVPRQNGGHSCSATETSTHSVLLVPGAVLGQGRCACVAQRQEYGQIVQNTSLVPQLQFVGGRRPPFVPQRQIPMVLPVQITIETPQLQSVRWLMPLLCRSCHARCRSDRCLWFRHCRILWRCRSCSSSISWTWSSTSLSWCRDRFPWSCSGP